MRSFSSEPTCVHSAHIGQDCVVHYLWHAHFGRRLRLEVFEHRAGSSAASVEVPSGQIVKVAAWIRNMAGRRSDDHIAAWLNRLGLRSGKTTAGAASGVDHGLHREIGIPDGDVLIHAGDFCSEGEAAEARSFGEFFRGLPQRHKAVIEGNHDRCLEADPGLGPEILAGCHYLLDSGVEIEGVTVWGSPWQPWFFGMAFNLERGAQLREKWDLIPTHVDVLITHGPPQFVLDRTETGGNVGCAELRAATE